MQLSDLEQICSESNLDSACRHVSKRFRSLKNHNVLAREKARALQRLSSPNFRLRSTGLKRLAKGDGSTRPIHRFDINDRIVFRAVHQILWPKLEPTIVASVAYCTYKSDGHHPIRGVRLAHLKISEARKAGRYYLLKTDIKGFYNRISRVQMLARLNSLLGDSDAKLLIPALLEVPVPSQADLSKEERDLLADGLPQGSATSPLFACLYLNEFDLWLDAEGLSAVRYVDDLAILLPSRDACKRMKKAIQEKLSALSLDLNPEPHKTKIVAPNQSVHFLGCKICPRGAIKPTPISWGRLNIKLTSIADLIGREADNEIATRMAASISSWTKARSHYHLVPSDIGRIQDCIAEALDRPYVQPSRMGKIITGTWLRVVGLTTQDPKFQKLVKRHVARL